MDKELLANTIIICGVIIESGLIINLIINWHYSKKREWFPRLGSFAFINGAMLGLRGFQK